jgi:hypothetical protein
MRITRIAAVRSSSSSSQSSSAAGIAVSSSPPRSNHNSHTAKAKAALAAAARRIRNHHKNRQRYKDYMNTGHDGLYRNKQLSPSSSSSLLYSPPEQPPPQPAERQSTLANNRITGTLGEGGMILVGQYAEKVVCYDQEMIDRYGRILLRNGNKNNTTPPPEPPFRWQCAPYNGDFRYQLLLPQGFSPAERKVILYPIVVPELLVSCLFTSIFGTIIPGAIYLNQSLSFDRPVTIGHPVHARIEVTKVRRSKVGNGKKEDCIVKCQTTVTNDDESFVYVTGHAAVWVPPRPVTVATASSSTTTSEEEEDDEVAPP